MGRISPNNNKPRGIEVGLLSISNNDDRQMGLRIFIL